MAVLICSPLPGAVFHFSKHSAGIVLISVVLCAPVKAQWSMGSRNIAMGQAYTALQEEYWALFHNPALIDQQNRMIGFFSIRYYGLSELEDHTAMFSRPLKFSISGNDISAGLAAGIHSYGFELYRETQLRTGWSARFQNFRFGFTAKYTHLRIRNYGSKGALLFDAGLAAGLTENIMAGIRVTNIFRGGEGSDEQTLYPAETAIGISWQVIPEFLLSMDLIKDDLYPVSLRSGVEFEMIPGVFLRGGWTSSPFTWSAGAGFRISRVITGVVVQNHDILGLSPGIDCFIIL